MSQQPHQSKANLHLGQIVLDSQIQRHTLEQKQADNENLQQAKEAELAATQKVYEHTNSRQLGKAYQAQAVTTVSQTGRYWSKGTREDYLETKKCNQSSMQLS
ncbi:hypothetical protein EDD17DRAFT_1508279 [Pisolithus thermaeus]|nr:hypothetical protein EDD17DRAFT_1508279 [Pisolithus thermaeus]